MGSAPSIPADKHIVIIGGGYGGKDLAMALIKMNVKVTVIDPKDFFHHNVASVRAFVDKSRQIFKKNIEYFFIYSFIVSCYYSCIAALNVRGSFCRCACMHTWLATEETILYIYIDNH